MGEAASHRPRYSDYNCKGVAGSLAPLRPLGKEKIVRTVRFDHLRTALLAVAPAGLLAALGLVVLFAQPAEANYPGKPGKIAYSGWDGNDLEIYTINPNGGSNLKVTNDQSGKDGNDWDIYTISINGGGRKNVTNNNADDIQPSYSPSGKNKAYVYDPGAGDAEIYYIKPDGGGRTPVTANNRDDLYPYWGSK